LSASNFPYAGYVNNSSLLGVGSNGYYWSRTVYSDNSLYAYRLNFSSSGVTPANIYIRFGGFPIRCVATT